MEETSRSKATGIVGEDRKVEEGGRVEAVQGSGV